MTEIPPSVPPGYPSGGAYTPPPPMSPPPSSDRTLMLVLSYLGILALIPLIVKKDDREVQWHAKNGLAMLIAFVAIQILWTVLQWVLPSSIGCALSFVGCGIAIGYLVLCIMGIMKAVGGGRLRVPAISDFADKM